MPQRDGPGWQLEIDDAEQDSAKRVIEEGLARFNEERAGYRDTRTLNVLIRSAKSRAVFGGLLGRTTMGLLFIDLLYVPPQCRGSGVGKTIVTTAEQEAIRRGCTAATLFTIHFQAPGFYQKLGYELVAEIACKPPGHRRLCMRKMLV